MSVLDNSVMPQATDPLYPQAVCVILDAGRPSISLLIRTFAIGYSRAARLIQAMEGDVVAAGELDRYTSHLQESTGSTFELKRLASNR